MVIYITLTAVVLNRVNTAKIRTGVNVWHQRYGHLVAKDELVSGISSDDLSDVVELCEYCSYIAPCSPLLVVEELKRNYS